MPQTNDSDRQPQLAAQAQTVSRAGDLAALAILALLGLAVYCNSFQGEFVFDTVTVIHAFSPDRFWPWQLNFSGSRPLGILSLSLNYALDAHRVWGYHAANLAIHVLAGGLLYGVVRRTLARPPLAERYAAASRALAFAIAAIWLVHPLQTECVTYIFQRIEALMAIFYLLTLLCFIRAQDSVRPVVWYALSVLACAAGMATKEVTVSAPLIVLWYDRAFVSTAWREILRVRWRYYAALAGTWLLLAFLMTRPSTMYESTGLLKVKGVTPLGHALSQPGVILHYLRLCFWPSDLCLDYGWPVAEHWTEIVPPLLVVLAILAATVWCTFRNPPLGFLGGWFFLILAPTSSIAPLKDMCVEHRLYLPLAAVVALVVLAAYQAWLSLLGPTDPARQQQGKVPQPWLAALALVVPLALLGGRTLLRNVDYRSRLAIWEDTARKAPRNTRAYKTLALYFNSHHEPKRAIEQLGLALAVNPDDVQALTNRATAYFELGNFEQALADTSQAIEIDPDYADAYFNRAGIYLKTSRPDLAAKDLAKTARLEADAPPPNDFTRKSAGTTFLMRANAYHAVGLHEAAANSYTQAIEWGRTETANYLNRGLACDRLGRYRDAKRDYDTVLESEPKNVTALKARAWLLAACPDDELRNGGQAVTDATSLCELTDWENGERLDTLAAAYAERGDFDQARQWEMKAIDRTEGNTPFYREFRKRLNLYRDHTPYRSEAESGDAL